MPKLRLKPVNPEIISLSTGLVSKIEKVAEKPKLGLDWQWCALFVHTMDNFSLKLDQSQSQIITYIRPKSDQSQTKVRPKSGKNWTKVRQKSDQSQTKVGPKSEQSKTNVRPKSD